MWIIDEHWYLVRHLHGVFQVGNDNVLLQGKIELNA